MTPALVSAAPSTLRSKYKRLEAAGWEVWVEVAMVRTGRTFYRGTDRAGEVKLEPCDVQYWQLRARRRHDGKMVAAFLATWESKGANRFVDAFTWDVVTKEKVLHTKLKDIDPWLDVLAPVRTKEKAA
ncbi:hypothetical protein G7068_00110 [Leucobacter viscericola]|nr:hypothetical protein [Leucobacter viscericola]QIK61787.1 hypothetical protein G7068_00110 [Leucobacter viscericola]